MKEIIPTNRLQNFIYQIRGKNVMIDSDLASLYQVETKQLKRAVRRNIGRFPKDFMFELTKREYNSLRCQIGTLKRGRHSKYLSYAFTEQGVAMLSSILNSKRAIQVNIQIMRAFVELRRYALTYVEIKRKIDIIWKKFAEHDSHFIKIYQAINQLLAPPPKKKNKVIGFAPPKKK